MHGQLEQTDSCQRAQGRGGHWVVTKVKGLSNNNNETPQQSVNSVVAAREEGVGVVQGAEGDTW